MSRYFYNKGASGAAAEHWMTAVNRTRWLGELAA